MTTPSTAAAASTAFTPANPELDAIRTTIGFYVDGLRDGSVETLQRGFHPQSTMCGYLGDTPMIVPIEGLYDFVRTHPSPKQSGEPFSAEIVSIEPSGNTATAEIREHSYQGFEFRTCFQLMKLDGRWQITAKLFNALGPSAS
jgi:hypothetical protein